MISLDHALYLFSLTRNGGRFNIRYRNTFVEIGQITALKESDRLMILLEISEYS